MARRSKSERLTPLELEIMKILWETGPATVQTVHRKIQSTRPLAYNTVQTMLTILHRKGRVRRTADNRAYVYSPAVSRERAAKQALQDVVNRLFGGNPEELVLSMVKTRQLTREQLARLQDLIADLEKGGGGGSD